MKILELRFKNLNSLYGEWSIDFTSPQYQTDGIFAITGPTGAGKSTILDAVCLALYGKTPRLEKISKSNNEIMSRLTGECFAEVTFEASSGKYRCHWYQHKARKKVDGELQEAKHIIEDARTNKPLETKKRNVLDVVENKTGMDFDRFTRSMLLAQGGFAAFLQAAPNERAPILEQITGTNIYSDISILVFERYKDEKDKFDKLTAESETIQLLTEEQEKELLQKLTCNKEIELELTGKNDSLAKKINWLQTLKDYQQEISRLHQEKRKVSQQLTEAEPKRERLKKAVKASELEADYATLNDRKNQQQQDKAALKKEKARLPRLVEALSDSEKQLKRTKENLISLKERQKKKLPLIRQVRDLDARISEKESNYTEILAELNRTKRKVTDNVKQKEKCEKYLEEAEQKLAKYRNYLQENRQDQMLVTNFSVISERLHNLKTVDDKLQKDKQKLEEKRQDIKKVNLFVEEKKTLFNELKTKLLNINNQIEKKKKEHNNLSGEKSLSELQSELTNLLKEKNYLKTIESWEEQRNKLRSGKPCPLCGSLEHPYARGNIPAVDETEAKIDEINALFKEDKRLVNEINKLKDKQEKLDKKLNNVDKDVYSASFQKKEQEKQIRDFEKELEHLLVSRNDSENKLLSLLRPLGEEKLARENLDNLLKGLKTRLNKWSSFQEKVTTTGKKCDELVSEIKRFDGIIKTLEDNLSQKDILHDKSLQELQALKKERYELFGRKDTDTQEKRLAESVADAEHTQEQIRQEYENREKEVKQVNIIFENLNNSIEKRQRQLQKITTLFEEKCRQNDFAGEQDFVDSRMSKQQREKIAGNLQELDAAAAEIAIMLRDRQTKLEQEQQKNITDKSIDELIEEQQDIRKKLKDSGEETGAIRQRLKDDEKKRREYQQKLNEREIQKKEFLKWDKLNMLIGSADGKKFRNFAQGITFEIMVANANKQLKKMSDRYLLVRDEEQPLELKVIDNYQAGEIRSTKNLSGGESFIVSLSLALGLSQMASRNVRVDSLFLDEGFGTLDEDALETALETLAGLQQEGKIIGIISHVPALKERINTRINVIPFAGGRSELQGPGCRRVN